MLVIKTIKNLDHNISEEWDNFVFNHPNANFFQASEIFNFFHGLNGIQPVTFLALENNKIAGVLSVVLMHEPGVKNYFSRRCIIWGGPLCYDKETASFLLKKASEHISSKCIYAEIRNLFDTKDYMSSFIQNEFRYIDWYTIVVSIDDYESVVKNLNTSKRRQITKSLKAGAVIREARSINEIKMLYSILSSLYKQKIKKPLPSLSYFEKFFINSTLGKIFIIEFEGEVVGGTVCPIYKDKIYELYVCGIDKKIKDVYPSVLATWAPIEYAAKNKLKYFDFLGAGSPNTDYGVREFKSQFGGELISFGRYIKIFNPHLYTLGKSVLKLSAMFK